MGIVSPAYTSCCFPEPCGLSGLPHQSALEGVLKEFASRDNRSGTPPAPLVPPPASCPACKSSSIVTTAKSPDADSYWRCTMCGEVWNDSRRQAPRHKMPGWR
ncbi:MAG: hypothetical protein DMF98_12700 [Acidobacteria bacterium]|nr:MAG: hypothetical protein DMF98_12700 [Acidobacteriota bacterium]